MKFLQEYAKENNKELTYNDLLLAVGKDFDILMENLNTMFKNNDRYFNSIYTYQEYKLIKALYDECYTEVQIQDEIKSEIKRYLKEEKIAETTPIDDITMYNLLSNIFYVRFNINYDITQVGTADEDLYDYIIDNVIPEEEQEFLYKYSELIDADQLLDQWIKWDYVDQIGEFEGNYYWIENC